MQNRFSSGGERRLFSKAAILGGVIGALIGVLLSITGSPITMISAIVVGLLVGAGIGSIMDIYLFNKTSENEASESEPKRPPFRNGRLQLLQEQMEISKELVDTADVDIHREVITEEKNITIPVSREEMVIEKKVFDEETAEETGAHSETIRIPISEERVDVDKHAVQLSDVDIYTNKYEENEHIEETLKKEKLKIEKNGDVNVIDKKEP